MLQSVYYVNTYLFSKIWFIAQCFKIEKKVLDQILAKALAFIYAGENERPIRPLNFRDKMIGGLGLINPIFKAKAMLLKNMYREFTELKGNINRIESYEHFMGI